MGKSAEVIEGKGVANSHGAQRVRKWMKRRRIVVDRWRRGRSGHTAVTGFWRNRAVVVHGRRPGRRMPTQRPSVVYQKVKISQGNSKCFGCKRLETRNWTLEAALLEGAEVVSFQRDSRCKKVKKPTRLEPYRRRPDASRILPGQRHSRRLQLAQRALGR